MPENFYTHNQELKILESKSTDKTVKYFDTIMLSILAFHVVLPIWRESKSIEFNVFSHL